MLPETRGKTYILRVLSVYTDLFRVKYGFYPTLPMSRWGASLKRLMETHSELQIAAMLIIFFNWRGMDDGDDFAEQKLIDAAHNFQWFFSTINTYEIYLRNVYNLEFNDEEKVKEFVDKSLSTLR